MSCNTQESLHSVVPKLRAVVPGLQCLCQAPDPEVSANDVSNIYLQVVPENRPEK